MSIDKFNNLIRDILSSSKEISRPPSPEIDKAKNQAEVSYISKFDTLRNTAGFKQIKDLINNLQSNNLSSRTRAIAKLKNELNGLSSCKSYEVVNNFICLCRRYFLFCEMDRIYLQIKDHPKRSDFVLDIAVVYFYLGEAAVRGDVSGKVIPNLSDEKVEEFIFETEAKKHWLEIMKTLAAHHLEGIFTKLPEYTKINLYNNWNDLTEEEILWKKRNKYFNETLEYVQETLNMKFDEYYMRKLLADLSSSASKRLIDKKLFALEEKIDLLITPPEQMSRTDAVWKLKLTIAEFCDSKSSFEDIYLASLQEYSKFAEFDKMLIEFRNIIARLYRGVRSLDPIYSAVNSAYYAYAGDADVVAAKQAFLVEVVQIRQFVNQDHVKNGLLSGWGMFQPRSNLVFAINSALETVELEETVVCLRLCI
ncbi:MAG: hypothetical protein V4501_01855 [Pseudomonadota bacterium]